MKRRGPIIAAISVPVFAVVLLCVVSAIGVAAFRGRDRRAAHADAPVAAVARDLNDDAGAADAGTDAGPPDSGHALALAEPAAPVRPSAEAIALDREYRREMSAHPGRDAYATVARRHRLDVAEASETIARVGETTASGWPRKRVMASALASSAASSLAW